MDIQTIIQSISNWFIQYGPKVLLAIVVLLIGLWIISGIRKVVDSLFEKKGVDESLRHFLSSLISIVLKVILVITVISMLGIETTSFIAVLAAASFAVGLALQGSLSNFAGGVMILIFKPFVVGDFITAQGHSGTVKRIEIFNTILKTPDNKTIIIPNGNLSNSDIVNFSTEPTRRVDMTFGISYESDVKEAKVILEKLVKADKRILKDPAHQIVLSELGDSSVNFSVRAWADSGDYWGIFFEMQEKVKEEFDKAKISIPYPQMDVHMKKD